MVRPSLDATSVHSTGRMLSWLVLALSAGCVNAIAFAECASFVTHVTGIVSRIGIDASNAVLLLEYLLVLGAFVSGAATSVFLSDGRLWRGLPTRPWLPLAATSLLLASSAVAGSMGVFGPFGGELESRGDFAFLGALAFAMGMQNACVATATGMLVRTTHMTGPATDLGIALATLAHPVPKDVRRSAQRSAVLRAGKIASFAVGAGAGLALASAFGFGALFVPAIAIGLVAASMLSVSVALEQPANA
jgi:uncharacterized membrane protein YoaK (UPF0700 family)